MSEQISLRFARAIRSFGGCKIPSAISTAHLKCGPIRATRLFVKINGETHYLWRAVDHEGEVLAVFSTKRRDRKAARAFLKRAMARFRDIKTLQKFASAHASIHNHFNHDRHLKSRDTFKKNRLAALDEWR